MGSMVKLSIVKGQQQDNKVKPLYRIFEENLKHHSHQIALIHNNSNEHDNESAFKTAQNYQQITYRQMNTAANKWARFLVKESKQHFLQPNEDGDFIIGVCMQPSDHLVTTLLAIWKTGAAYLPIDPSFPANRVEHILQESKPIMVVCDDHIDKQRFGKTLTFSITEIIDNAQQFEENLIPDDMLAEGSKHLAVVLYTSGSTGVPKGVRLPHEVILNRLQWQWNTFPYKPQETVTVFKTTLTFVDSVAELWGPLLCGKLTKTNATEFILFNFKILVISDNYLTLFEYSFTVSCNFWHSLALRFGFYSTTRVSTYLC